MPEPVRQWTAHVCRDKALPKGASTEEATESKGSPAETLSKPMSQYAPTTVLYLSHAAECGGAEHVLGHLLGALDRARYRPVALLAREGEAAELARCAGAETHVLQLPEPTRTVKKDTLGTKGLLQRPVYLAQQAAATLHYATRVARFARRCGADVIHTNSMKAHLYGGLAGQWAGVPVVWHMHDRVHQSYLPRPAVWAVRALARLLPRRVVAISESVLKTLRLPEERGVVVQNGLPAGDLDALAEARRDGEVQRDGSVGDSSLHVGLVGRIARWKGQHLFLRAAARILGRLPPEHPGVRFQIVGAPLFDAEDYEAELRDLAQDLGIAGQVDFLGFREDIPAVLAGLDVLVHASISPEPFGLVVIEGMAAGVPVVAADAGGVAEIVSDNETGLLYPMGDAGALARCIEHLLREESLRNRLAEAGLNHVREHFTAERMAQRIERIYDEASTYS